MQQTFKSFQPLRWLAVVLLSSALFFACKSKETKTVETTETKTVIQEEKKDSIPALDNDSNSTTRPETIKNK